jgi:hypothetical protein
LLGSPWSPKPLSPCDYFKGLPIGPQTYFWRTTGKILFFLTSKPMSAAPQPTKSYISLAQLTDQPGTAQSSLLSPALGALPCSGNLFLCLKCSSSTERPSLTPSPGAHSFPAKVTLPPLLPHQMAPNWYLCLLVCMINLLSNTRDAGYLVQC